MPEGTLSTYLSSNCCKTAKRESDSFLQPHGPSLRFLPQRKQTPLQSGLHRSWLSMLRTKAVVMMSVRSAQPSWIPNTHSSSACSNSSSETRTAWIGICTAGAAVAHAVQRRGEFAGKFENARRIANLAIGQNWLRRRLAAAENKVGQIFVRFKRKTCAGRYKNRL